MNFHQRIELAGRGDFEQMFQFLLRERGHDEQDRDCTGRGSLVNLHDLQHEILPQNEHADRVSHRHEIVEVPLEKTFVGQNGNRVGTGGLVAQRDLDGIETLRDDAGGRRSPLDLGDQGQRPATVARERTGKGPELIAMQRCLAEFGAAGTHRCEGLAFVVEDFGQAVHATEVRNRSADTKRVKAFARTKESACTPKRGLLSVEPSSHAGVAQW